MDIKLDSPAWIKNKAAAVKSLNKYDGGYFQPIELNHQEIGKKC